MSPNAFFYEDSLIITPLRRQLAAANATIRRIQTIIDNIPKTADGVGLHELERMPFIVGHARQCRGKLIRADAVVLDDWCNEWYTVEVVSDPYRGDTRVRRPLGESFAKEDAARIANDAIMEP